jgi:hypothetical protein
MYRRLQTAVPFAMLLALSGCKQEKAPEADVASAAVKQKTTVPEGPSRDDVRTGVGKMLPSVQRHDAGMDLRNIAQLYAADFALGSPPKKVEDMKELDARAVQAVKDGAYVVVWNASPNSPGSAIVAYEKDVPTNGGMVADLTGAVRKTTPQEFKTAPKAAPR